MTCSKKKRKKNRLHKENTKIKTLSQHKKKVLQEEHTFMENFDWGGEWRVNGQLKDFGRRAD